MIKTIVNKQIMVGADFAGFELKEAVRKYLIACGWEVTNLTPVKIENGMYNQAGFVLGSKIVEGESERVLAFCGTGMGIHVAASKVPHAYAAVAGSVRAMRWAAAANGYNLLTMGGFWTGHRLDMAMVDAFLESHFGSGYEDREGFLEYHQIGFNEREYFDYEACRVNGSQVTNPAAAVLGPEPEGLAY